MSMEKEFAKLIDVALSKASGINIFTFALYQDHESGFVSVCLDTKENSELQLAESNAYSMKHFRRAIESAQLEEARLWQANVGRNLSLGDFEAVNIAELEIGDHVINDSFYLDMVRAIQGKAPNVLRQSSHKNSLLFCCSTEDDEVGLVWVEPDA